MDLIINKVVQLKEVDPADGDIVVKLFAGAAVVQLALAVLTQAGLTQSVTDGLLVGAVEDRSCDLPAESLCGIAEVDFQDLTDIHTGRNAQRIKDDIKRSAVGQIRHILTGQDTGNNALVAVAAGHLVADGYLTLLRNVNSYDFVYAGAHLVAVFTGKALNINDDAALAVVDFE